MAKIPKQLHVVAKEDNDHPLGFLHDYAPNTFSFAKKKDTQLKWAYNPYSVMDAEFIEEFGEMYVTGFKWGPWKPNVQHVKVPYKEKIKYPPTVWDNDPLTGFKVLTTVSRYSTSNKLWRILDPRGYQFEISTSSMEEIIHNATIVKGVIQEPCQWVSNKNLIVVI